MNILVDCRVHAIYLRGTTTAGIFLRAIVFKDRPGENHRSEDCLQSIVAVKNQDAAQEGLDEGMLPMTVVKDNAFTPIEIPRPELGRY
jgi:hypothetical protein